MKPAALEHAGQSLYGRQWKGPLAAALLVSRHTVDNWHAGRSTIPGPAVAAMALLQAACASAKRPPVQSADAGTPPAS
jgi:hypothetical protein